jgi:hypothetical protein
VLKEQGSSLTEVEKLRKDNKRMRFELQKILKQRIQGSETSETETQGKMSNLSSLQSPPSESDTDYNSKQVLQNK